MTDKPKRGILSLSIEVRKKDPAPAALPQFHVFGRSTPIDLRPIAREVIDDYPEPVELSVDDLADFSCRSHDGKYVRVADYPTGATRDQIKEMANRVLRWSGWEWRKDQPVVRGAFPKRAFKCGPDACEAAQRMQGLAIDPTETVRLPLKGCWGRLCECDYRLVKRDGTMF